MGILNATPDSFYQHHEGAEAIRLRTRQMLAEGAAILDVGACSTRPGFTPPDEQEEMWRLREALAVVREEAPEGVVSVDTFRASVAKMCVEEFGVQMVNDISGGELDKEMFRMVAELHVPYILTHNKALAIERKQEVVSEVLRDLGGKVETLHELGVCDIIIDPGFGFGKTLEENYILMQNLEVLHELYLPLLVGVSHKSMIYKLLGTTPGEALNGTTVLKGGRSIQLKPLEFDLLLFFLRNQNIALPREKILTEVWGLDFYGESRTIDIHVSQLRKKTGLPIVSVPRVGYRLETMP